MSELPAIDVKGVSKIFPGTKVQDFAALDDVSVTIRKNEFFTLLGPSGCGKTTLLRMIAGFEYPTRGTILLHGSDIVGLPPNKRPVNTVFQSYALFPHMTVAENVGFGLQMLGKPQSEVNSRVVEMLRLVRMEDLSQRRTSQISGGQQQRVALARALAPKPQVLLLDEPLSALDAKLRKDMQIELKRMQSETGITFIFVTHDQEEALTMSDRIAVMNAGRILQVGNPQQIYGEPENRFVANFIGETNFLKASYEGAGKRLRLAAGGHVDAPSPQAMLRNGEITLMVRPEHAALTAPGRGALNGVVSAVVYFGTDTMIHLKLGDGTDFVVRQQNDRKGSNAVVQGDRRGIVLGPGAARVLAD